VLPGENLREVALREPSSSMALRQAWQTAAAAARHHLLCGGLAPVDSTASVPHGRGRPQARTVFDWRLGLSGTVEHSVLRADPSAAGGLPMSGPAGKRPWLPPAGRPHRVAGAAGRPLSGAIRNDR